jgi:hypothetical protein
MTAAECIREVIDALDRLGVAFMVVGSFSSNVYGLPRSTKYADFVIQQGSQSLASVAAALHGAFSMDPQASFETVTGTTKYRFVHRQTDFEIEFFNLSDDEHDRLRFERRVRGNIEGRFGYLPTAEDVIVTKLRWARSAKRQKDIDDIRGILQVQAGRLDLQYIRNWTERHGTHALLERLIAE